MEIYSTRNTLARQLYAKKASLEKTTGLEFYKLKKIYLNNTKLSLLCRRFLKVWKNEPKQRYWQNFIESYLLQFQRSRNRPTDSKAVFELSDPFLCTDFFANCIDIFRIIFMSGPLLKLVLT
jgi:hypothetical protein